MVVDSSLNHLSQGNQVLSVHIPSSHSSDVLSHDWLICLSEICLSNFLIQEGIGLNAAKNNTNLLPNPVFSQPQH